jgi:hypothetical protein
MQMKKRKRKIKRKTARTPRTLRAQGTRLVPVDLPNWQRWGDRAAAEVLDEQHRRLENFVHKSIVPRAEHLALQISAALDALNRAEGSIENMRERMRVLEAMELHPAVLARRILALERRVDSGERTREAPSRLDQIEHEIRSLRVDLNKIIEKVMRVQDVSELLALAKDKGRHEPPRPHDDPTRPSGWQTE